MARKRLLREYKRSLKNIHDFTRSLGLNDSEFELLFEECLISAQKESNIKTRPMRRCMINFLWILVAIVVLMFAFNHLFDGKPFTAIFCKIQELIYPGLKLLRIISIPLITAFPSLTELYDETCLIQNPFFRITDMDCWPCNSITFVAELTSTDFEPNSSPPFLYKTNQKAVNFEDLQNVYKENPKVFDKDAYKIIINNKNMIMAHNFFNNFMLNETGRNFLWRINRMFPAQLIRALFPRPKIIPRLGLSTERFVSINEPGSDSYPLTDPECNFVFVIQSQGERLIEMRPTSECKNQCYSISVLLKSPNLLWYNWWYWRPVSLPTDSNMTSISYTGSYC